MSEPDDDETVDLDELWVRIGTGDYEQAVKTLVDDTPPSITFTYTVTFGSNPYLGLADFRLVEPGGDPEVPADVVASVNDVVVRAAQGCETPDVDVTVSSTTRVCTAPTVLTGTLVITGNNAPEDLGTVGLDLYNGGDARRRHGRAHR